MKVFRDIAQVQRAVVAGGSLTIGNFDGVHLGHRRLIERAGELARPAVVMLFHPHPMVVLNPRQAPPVLTPLDVRLELIAEAGADAAVVVAADAELLALSPERFVRELVAGQIGPSVIVEGVDFGFGLGRSGDVDTLRDLGRTHGFTVEVVPPVMRTLSGHHEPLAISSTLIRRLISGGSVDAAGECLGRPYRLIGTPVAGRGQGRRIGFPTVNLDVGEQLTPADGVYAGAAQCGGQRYLAAVSVGPAPTFNFHQSAVEAHLLDFSGELDHRPIAVDLLARLRGIRQFDSIGDLVEQVRQDVEQVRRIASSFRPRPAAVSEGADRRGTE